MISINRSVGSKSLDATFLLAEELSSVEASVDVVVSSVDAALGVAATADEDDVSEVKSESFAIGAFGEVDTETLTGAALVSEPKVGVSSVVTVTFCFGATAEAEDAVTGDTSAVEVSVAVD